MKNRHEPSEPCHLLIFRKCGQWKAAALDRCTRKWAPRIGERGEISPFSTPLGATLQFSQTVYSFALDKKPKNIPDPEEVISGQQRIYTYRGRFQARKDSYLQRDPHDGDGFFGWWKIPNERTLKANGSPLEAFRELFEDHFRYIGWG